MAVSQSSRISRLHFARSAAAPDPRTLRRSAVSAIFATVSSARSCQRRCISSKRASSSRSFAVSCVSASSAIRRSRAPIARRSRSRASRSCSASSRRLCRSAISCESSISCVLSEARARLRISSGIPSRAAISSPADLPGKPDLQLISGRQRLLVEPHRRVEHRLRVRAVNLQRRQVRGSERESPGRAKMIHQRHAQRAALFRIGCRTDLVQQHQRIRRHIERHLAQAAHTCAENVLRFCSIDWLSPISASTCSKTGSSADAHGTGRPACAIRAIKPDGLQSDGFAARIRTADQQGAALAIQRQAERHHAAASDAAARPSTAGAARCFSRSALAKDRECSNRTRCPNRALAKIRSSAAMIAAASRIGLRIGPQPLASVRAESGTPRASLLPADAPVRC